MYSNSTCLSHTHTHMTFPFFFSFFSFEIKNTRLMHKLLQQFSRTSLPKGPDCLEQLNALADRFEGLPLYFMKFHGGSQVDDVLDAME